MDKNWLKSSELDLMKYINKILSIEKVKAGNSDYKSASSVERIEAFIDLGRPDPVQYEDESGPVEYNVAKAYVKRLLSDHVAVKGDA